MALSKDCKSSGFCQNWLGVQQHAECVLQLCALQLTLSCEHGVLCAQLRISVDVLRVECIQVLTSHEPVVQRNKLPA